MVSRCSHTHMQHILDGCIYQQRRNRVFTKNARAKYPLNGSEIQMAKLEVPVKTKFLQGCQVLVWVSNYTKIDFDAPVQEQWPI